MIATVAIVGRPNVGKSTLFNRLIRSRKAIVQDDPGVTRDRHYGIATIDGRRLQLIDTGGFEPDEEEGIDALIRAQAEIAIDEADVIIFVMDGRVGLTDTDKAVAQSLRKTGKPVVYVANKVESPKQYDDLGEFYALGVDAIYPVSAEHGRGLSEMADALFELLPPVDRADLVQYDDEEPSDEEVEAAEDDEGRDEAYASGADGDEAEDSASDRDQTDNGGAEEDDAGVGGVSKIFGAGKNAIATGSARSKKTKKAPPREIRVALVGRPNAGKSSLLNLIAGSPRAIVSDMPGTTRDPIDHRVELPSGPYVIIDTAGIRRKRTKNTFMERLAIIRAMRVIESADTTCLVIDGEAGVTEQDAKVAGLVLDAGKGLVLVVNKTDLLPKGPKAKRDLLAQIQDKLQFVTFAPILFVSAATGHNVEKLFPLIRKVDEASALRVSTATLNGFIREVWEAHQPPAHRGKAIRLLYMTQPRIRPPTFVISASQAQGVHVTYRRYIVNRIRERFGFEGNPIRLFIRDHQRGNEERRINKKIVASSRPKAPHPKKRRR